MTKRQTPAQIIKAELKKAFPGVKFSCKYRSFSMGDNVTISWKGGPLKEDVEKIAYQYQAGHFDGMIDMYEYTNDKPSEITAKYVFCERESDDEETEKWINELGLDVNKEWNTFNELFETLSDIRHFLTNSIKNRLNYRTKNEGINYDYALNKRHEEMGWVIANYIVDHKYC